MIEESIVQSNFIGRDGFRWWIGQVAPEKAQGDQINQAGDSWGNRIKVRIMGYHPQNTVELKDDELPWAQVLLPTTAGSGGGGFSRSIRIVPGDSVFGFFLDGDDAQLPVIIGTFGRSKSGYIAGEYTSPFVPFTGYTSQNPPSNYFANTEVGDQSGSASTPIPVALGSENAEKVNETQKSAFDKALGDAISEVEQKYREVKNSHGIVGKEVNFATASGDDATVINNIVTEVKDLVGTIQEITKGGPVGALQGAAKQLAEAKIGSSIDFLTSLGGGMARGMLGNLQKEMGIFANTGLQILYDNVFSKVFAAVGKFMPAKIAGTNAIEAFIDPLKGVFDGVNCAMQNVMKGLKNTVSTLINGLIDNVANFVTCVGEQFVGGLVNSIIGLATNALSGPLGFVSKIMGLAGFPGVGGVLRKGAEALSKILNLFKCDDEPTKSADTVQKVVVGLGPVELLDGAIDTIMEVANTADSLAVDLAAGVQSLLPESSLGLFDFMNPAIKNPPTFGDLPNALGNCYAGPPLSCAGIDVKIFGSDGAGATARAILGNRVGDAVEGVGSIIGFDLGSGGSGYTSPPFVQIVDTCKKGYGAVARAIIDHDRNSDDYGKVIDIEVVSGGVNYPVGIGTSTIDSDDEDIIIDDLSITDTGGNYEPEDKVLVSVDGGGDEEETEEYDIDVDEQGRIVNVRVPNDKKIKLYNDIPQIRIRTSTGFGAVIRPKFKIRPDFQGDVKKVVDCVS